ncbi:MAG: hypothetical protein AAF542_16980 [Pseudomonadota bacterium]
MNNETRLLRKSLRYVKNYVAENRYYFEFLIVCFFVCIGSLMHGYALLTDWPISESQSGRVFAMEALLGVVLMIASVVRVIGFFVFSLDAVDFWGLLGFLRKPEFYFSTTCLMAINLLGAYVHLYSVFLDADFGIAFSVQFVFGVLLAGAALDAMIQCYREDFLSDD